MGLEIKLNSEGIDWKTISETLKSVGMKYYDPDTHKKAFEASFAKVFIYDSGRLIAFGRAISDGVCQAAIYDCAVNPEYQGRGIGNLVLSKVLEDISHCNAILYASPGKEGFYLKNGFRKMKTGMALFLDSESKKEKGFIE